MYPLPGTVLLRVSRDTKACRRHTCGGTWFSGMQSHNAQARSISLAASGAGLRQAAEGVRSNIIDAIEGTGRSGSREHRLCCHQLASDAAR
jgi:hypothetical protein